MSFFAMKSSIFGLIIIAHCLLQPMRYRVLVGEILVPKPISAAAAMGFVAWGSITARTPQFGQMSVYQRSSHI